MTSNRVLLENLAEAFERWARSVGRNELVKLQSSQCLRIASELRSVLAELPEVSATLSRTDTKKGSNVTGSG